MKKISLGIGIIATIAPSVLAISCEEQKYFTSIQPLKFHDDELSYDKETKTLTVNKTITNIVLTTSNSSHEIVQQKRRDCLSWLVGLFNHSIVNKNYEEIVVLKINGSTFDARSWYDDRSSSYETIFEIYENYFLYNLTYAIHAFLPDEWYVQAHNEVGIYTIEELAMYDFFMHVQPSLFYDPINNTDANTIINDYNFKDEDVMYEESSNTIFVRTEQNFVLSSDIAIFEIFEMHKDYRGFVRWLLNNSTFNKNWSHAERLVINGVEYFNAYHEWDGWATNPSFWGIFTVEDQLRARDHIEMTYWHKSVGINTQMELTIALWLWNHEYAKTDKDAFRFPIVEAPEW